MSYMPRENFSRKIKDKINKEVGDFCCKCNDYTRDGEYAHIISLQKSGPRSYTNYSELTDIDEELRILILDSHENGLYLCRNCHSEIDKRENDYPQDVLRKMRKDAVERYVVSKEEPYLEYVKEDNIKYFDIIYAKFIDLAINIIVMKKFTSEDQKMFCYLIRELCNCSSSFESTKWCVQLHRIIINLGRISPLFRFKTINISSILMDILRTIYHINHPEKHSHLKYIIIHLVNIILEQVDYRRNFDNVHEICEILPNLVVISSHWESLVESVIDVYFHQKKTIENYYYLKLKVYMSYQLEVGEILKNNGDPAKKIKKAKDKNIFPADYSYYIDIMEEINILKAEYKTRDEEEEIDTVTMIQEDDSENTLDEDEVYVSFKMKKKEKKEKEI